MVGLLQRPIFQGAIAVDQALSMSEELIAQWRAEGIIPGGDELQDHIVVIDLDGERVLSAGDKPHKDEGEDPFYFSEDQEQRQWGNCEL